MNFQEFKRQMAYHAPTPDGRIAIRHVRERIESLGEYICDAIPASPERTIALRALHDARMKCNAALMLSGPEMGIPQE